MAALSRGAGLCLLALGCGMPVTAPAEEAVSVPSGHDIRFLEQVSDSETGVTYQRFRFVAPEIGGGGLSFDDVTEDMGFLCQNFALPRLEASGAATDQIVISLSEKPTEFGAPAPDVVQFFESYSVQDGRCIWEVF